MPHGIVRQSLEQGVGYRFWNLGFCRPMVFVLETLLTQGLIYVQTSILQRDYT